MAKADEVTPAVRIPSKGHPERLPTLSEEDVEPYALVRPYPRSVAGVPHSFSYDPDTQTFELAFDPSPSATLPTEIYLPAARHYPDGWSLSGCEEAAGCTSTWNADAETLEILTPNQTARVELEIAPDR